MGHFNAEAITVYGTAKYRVVMILHEAEHR